MAAGSRTFKSKYAKALGGLLEALEPRHLLSVDLSGAFLAEPSSVLSGTKQAVTVNVANSGDTTARGSMTIAFYAALDGTAFDPNTARLLGQVTKTVSIAGGGSLNVNYALPVSAALQAGTYRFYAVIDAANKIAETNKGNNTAQSATVAVAQPNYDLLAAFDPSSTLPPAILAGQTTPASMRVVITNSSGGTATLPAGQKVLVQVVARPVGAADASQDVVLNRSVASLAVGSLAPGKSRAMSIALQFPASLADGNYAIVVKVDTGNALTETNESNNEGTFSHGVVVAPPFSDPALTFNSRTVLPPEVVADGRKLPLKLDVTNLGNVTIPRGQTSSIALVAHRISDGTDTPLQTFVVSLTGLGSGRTKTVTLTPIVPLNLANGEYAIKATLATTAAGDLAGNDTASSVATLHVGPAFYNLGMLAPTSSFNPAVILGIKVSGTVTVRVKNLSNTLIPPGTLATVTVALRPVGAVTNANDITIGTARNASLSTLALGATRTFRVSSTIPATLPNGDPLAAGDYQLVATVAPATLAESTLADNVALGDTTTLAAPFIDLAITSASQNFPTPAASGSPGIGTVILRNMGNVAVQGNVTIQFFATPDGSAVSSGIGSRTFQVNLLPGASSPPLSTALSLNLPAGGLLATSATVMARIDPASLTDANPANNQLAAGTVIVSSQFVDLMISSATNPFTGTMHAGDTGTGHILIGNIGSGFATGQVTISYYASLGNTLDGSEILLGSQSVTVNQGLAQLSPTVNVPLTLPSPGASTTYKILAKLTAPLTLDNNPDNNLTLVLGTVTVLPPGP